MLRASNLSTLPWLDHGFTTRAAGDMRCAAAQRHLRQTIATAHGGRWQWSFLEQVHGSLIWRVPRPAGAPRACVGDGLVTAAPGRLLAIRTADCVPVLLADPEHRVVAAIHAGWRGTVQRVVEKAVGELRRQFGVQPAALRAAIGPRIGACCYRVGADVVEAFRAQFAYAEELFQPAEPDPVRSRYPMLFMTGAPPGHPYDPRWNPDRPVTLDLAAANRRQLLAAGVPTSQIQVLPYCTYCRSRMFYSFRRQGATAGRMAAWIGVRKTLQHRASNRFGR